jgi:hypothetical protein
VVTVIFFQRGLDQLTWRHSEEAPTPGQVFLPLSTTEEAIVPNALEAVGQDVEKETPDELIGGHAHRFDPISMTIILPVKADLLVFHIQ